LKRLLDDIIENPQFSQNIAWNFRTFKANDEIVKQGDLGDTLFFIQQGTIRVTGNVELDEQKNIKAGICDLEAGAIFGETCLHEANPRMATVVAITDVKVIEINGEKLSAFLDAHPILGYLFYKQLFEIFVKRLHIANKRVEHLMAWGLKVHDIDKYLG